MAVKRACLVFAVARGVLAGPRAAVANPATNLTCAELIEHTYGCQLASDSCGICVTRAWPRLRTEPSCNMGHGELLKHCKHTADASNDQSDDGDNTLAGLFKSTWAASDPVNTTLPALLKYLPVESTPDSCPGQVCACGSCGRTQMLPSSSVQFGLHTVAAQGLDDCRATSPLTGDLTVSDVEAIFDSELGEMREYSPFMDYNAMLWTPATTLDAYRQAFDDDGIPTLRLRWPCFYDDSEPTWCYSLIWHIPKSMVTIEISSNQTSNPSDFTTQTAPRHLFVTKDGEATNELPNHTWAEPLHDSRATDDIYQVIDWYARVLGISPTAVRESEDASITVIFAFPSSAKMGHSANVQYVQRPAVESRSRGITTSWLQSYWNNVSATYMTNMTSLWPIWGDNHLSFFDASENATIDAVIERLDASGDTLYHPYLGVENGEHGPDNDWFGHTVLYIQDPTGWTVEYHAPFLDPPRSVDVDKGDFNEYCDYHCGERPVS